MSAEDQNIPSVAAINKQLVELRRDLGRVAVESGSTNSQAVKAVQARIAELTAQLQEAEAARERSVPPPLNPTSTLQALERLGRNAKPKRVQQQAQPELPLFDPAKLEIMDDASASTDPAEHDPIMQTDKWLKHLREFHRQLSEQLVQVNRELARLADDAAPELREEAETLRAKQAEVEAEIEAETKAFKALLQAEKQRKAIEPAESVEEGKGLVKVRHPNRDFFLADMFDYALKDDGASMEAPIFTLSTKPDLSIWEWSSKDGNKYVKVAPSVLGRATQHDKDVLIYVVSQLTEALNRGRDDAKNRTVRFTVYDFLVTTNRQTSGQGYKLLQEAFERLAGTRITTDIKTGRERVKQGFGIIDEWRIIEKSKSDERMIAVHMVHLSDEEIALIAQQGVHLVHNPSSNLKLASGVAPLKALEAAGVNTILGTDGAASNNRQDMFSEIRAAALLAKGVTGDPLTVSARTALEMATVRAAKAMGRGADLGTLEAGKLADVVAVSLGALECQPVYHADAQLVYVAGREHVSDTWVGGRQLLKNRTLTSIDVPALLARTEDIVAKMRAGR